MHSWRSYFVHIPKSLFENQVIETKKHENVEEASSFLNQRQDAATTFQSNVNYEMKDARNLNHSHAFAADSSVFKQALRNGDELTSTSRRIDLGRI